MDDLIARLEKATGPDRKLDEALFELMHGRKRQRSTFEQYEPSETLPAYTASTDAALTLVPTGWAWSVGSCCVSDDAWMAPDYNSPEHGDRLRREIGGPVKDEWTDSGIDVAYGPSGTPAIALCIAAIKARKLVTAGNPSGK